VLDAVAVVVVSHVAGADIGVALRLGLGMLALQFAIGSANDFADSSADCVAKPWKPIPAGLLSRSTAAAVCIAAAVIGLAAAATVGAAALAIGTVGLADGLLYDLRLKSTPMAWIPFAAGVGLLPLYAWWGARGSVPVAFVGVIALSLLAGSALALANAYADIEQDGRSGIRSIAVALGAGKTLLIDAVLLASVHLIAVATTVTTVGLGPLIAVEAAGCGLSWIGLSLGGVERERLRPLVWELQAVGLVILGMCWLAALNSAGLLRS
jgi:geranylgeranylglycerol-phosphate geranylgeranyltransferase